ncbi:MAG: methyltransferase domain-containing protein [Candidatus Omnitrophota bacterium]|nr:methyltransferase domain-containing protein [Candidatus Omnitrophota bacterium]
MKEVDDKFEIVTAFEVFEHFEDPLTEIGAMLKLEDTVFFTTELMPADTAKLRDWWYFVPELGQHIVFYSKHALETIALKCNVKFYSESRSNHLFTSRDIKEPFSGNEKHMVNKFIDYTQFLLFRKKTCFTKIFNMAGSLLRKRGAISDREEAI